jgi:glycine reductase
MDLGEGGMSTMTVRVVHYINQFYAGLGGEEAANALPESRKGAVGPGVQLQTLFGGKAEIVGTVICGDGTYGERTEEARADCIRLIEAFRPDLLVAGPAFNAGRYGFACGDICSAVSKVLGIPTVTALYPENPGVELFAKNTVVVKTADSARGMKAALEGLARIGLKLVSGEPLGPARLEGTISRGIRKNFFFEKNGAERAVEMLLDKIAGRPFRTEYEMPVFKRIPPAPPIKDLKKATIALVCSGGIVPKGNPDHIRVSSAETYGRYNISELNDLTPETYESIHGGYDRVWANQDPDVVLPVDVMRELEQEGFIGKLYDWIYTTTGTGTAVAHAERFGREIGAQLKEAGVDGVILTST